MKLFGEEVKHTSTNSPLNILQVESFEEIFFDVFEVELNNTKLPLEKVSEYHGNVVVNLPIVVEGEEVLYPFVLMKGSPSILFNESNKDLPVEYETYGVIESEEILTESKQDILNEIKKAKQQAEKAIKESKLRQVSQISEKTKKNNKALRNTLERARETLVHEFITISDKIKSELIKESETEYSEMKKSLDNKLVDICSDLEQQLQENFNDASKIFDSNIKNLVKELYTETVYPKVEKELGDIAKQIVEKVGEIEATFDEKLRIKERRLVEGVSKEILNIKKVNVELNDNINKGVNKALSRAGNVKNLVEKIDKELNEKLSSELTTIENYFDEKIQNIQEHTVDITDESRRYIIDLVNKSKVDLLEEIRKIPTEKPIEYIIESSKKDPEKVNVDKLKKEYDTIIHDKFENYKTDLRRYIAVYSGGGSVAQQFAAGGTMNGNLVVVGSVSASQYLGIPSSSGGSDVSTLSANWQNTYTTVQSNSAGWNYQGTDLKALSSNWQSNYTTVQSNSANWQTAYTTLSTKASLTGGNSFSGNQTISGILSSSGRITTSGQGTWATLSANDVVTKSIGDLTYGETLFSIISADSASVVNSTAVIDTGASIILTPGTWNVTTMTMLSASSIAAGGRSQITLSNSCHCSGLMTYADGAAANFPRTAMLSDLNTTTIGGNPVGAVLSYWKHDNIVIATANTTLKTQFAQSTATIGTSTVCKAGSWVLAKRLL